jgi:hypothetical protein
MCRTREHGFLYNGSACQQQHISRHHLLIVMVTCTCSKVTPRLAGVQWLGAVIAYCLQSM